MRTPPAKQSDLEETARRLREVAERHASSRSDDAPERHAAEADAAAVHHVVAHPRHSKGQPDSEADRGREPRPDSGPASKPRR